MIITLQVLSGDSAVIKFIGAFAGHVIEFKVIIFHFMFLQVGNG